MLAEMGLNMRQYPTHKHLTSWSGLAPGNRQSGGKRYSGRTRKGNRNLATVTVQAAWSAVRTKDTFLKSRYHRLAARRGKKRAIVAIARSILASAWHMLTYRQPYHELGGDYFDQRRKEAKVSYHTRPVSRPRCDPQPAAHGIKPLGHPQQSQARLPACYRFPCERISALAIHQWLFFFALKLFLQ
jgi:hypothetical protein